MVWREKDGAKMYTARDSGCSCPVPFEDYNLRNIDPLDFETLRREVNDELNRDGTYLTPQIAQEFLAKVRNSSNLPHMEVNP